MNSTSGWVGEKVLFLKGEYTESSDMYIVHLGVEDGGIGFNFLNN
jgi:hypothetical protein